MAYWRRLCFAASAAWLILLFNQLAAPRGQFSYSAPARRPTGARPVHSVLVGTSSCSGRACHGNIEPAAGPASARWNASFTIWRRDDPHARSYETLLKPAAQAIGKKLNLRGPASDETVCLACHANPVTAENDSPEIVNEKLFGVGCEACHGSAGNWLESHKSTEWRIMKPARKRLEYDKYGMTWLASPTQRAGKCVGCHVGAPPDYENGLPGRDVNHDLIAAGHPRMRFEFSTFMAGMPKHWDEKKNGPAAEVAAWAVGQAVAARAALALLADRAGNPKAPWPRFAEYDCFACHHDLHEPSGRRGRRDGHSPGALPWGGWYVAGLLALAPLPGRDVVDASLHDIQLRMTKPFQHRREIARIAREVNAAIKQWPEPLETAASGKDSLRDLSHRLGRELAAVDPNDWDSLEQLCRGLALVHRAYQSSGLSISEADRRLDDALLKMISKLALPKGRQSPGDFRSKPDFDTTLRELLEQVRR